TLMHVDPRHIRCAWRAGSNAKPREVPMSAETVDIGAVWKQASDTAREIVAMLGEGPSLNGFEITDETCTEMQQAAALLRRALRVLRRLADSENREAEKIALMAAGELPLDN